MISSRGNATIHYAWVIVFTGMLCIFAGLGFGRFAIGMLLPAMTASLHLSYGQMGIISTGNFIGYLLAVLVCGHLTSRFGSRRVIFFALLLVSLTMLLISRAENFLSVAALYLLTGMGCGASNVPMVSLVPAWFTSAKRGKAAGFIAIGSGFAILISGRLIPFLNTLAGTDGWRLSWQVLGGVVLLVAIICLILLRDTPAELGLRPLGADAGTPLKSTAQVWEQERPFAKKTIYHLGLIYFLFGYTYVIYATFIVTTLVRERGFSETLAGSFWSWIGLLSLFSGPVFGSLSDRFGRRTGLITVFAIQMLAYSLVAFSLPPFFLYLSIGCYGLVAWSIPSIMAALVGDYVGARQTARVFGFITFIFALGQIAGPTVAGILAEATGSFAGSFLMAAVVAGGAVICSFTLPRDLSAAHPAPAGQPRTE